ncbi:hypothetical protein OHA27_37390 [Streptomyces sp. NBC_01619]|uniref:hypothetical protein n=1 Tax=Streptomyces sp. NBC_01619 TaxID=2975901 RepID=UPI002259ED4D|nr:hypothetical protein [Streptomyces sp. NBC_01619]MCX4515821.1 hypothetical protein [Streptomyces sp. NBC_01619]
MTDTTPTPNPIDAQAQMTARIARQRRQARAERIERKRTEHLRGHLPLDTPDRHALDVVDTAYARLAPGYTQDGE